MRLKTDSRTNVKKCVADLIIMPETDVIKKDLNTGDNDQSGLPHIHWRMSEGGRFVLVQEDDPIHPDRAVIATIPSLGGGDHYLPAEVKKISTSSMMFS